MTAWQVYASRLATELSDAGKLRSPEWRKAVEQVPRHVLVPFRYERDSQGTWRRHDTTTPIGLPVAYSNRVLITLVDDSSAIGETVLSSASMPGLVTRMLEAIDVREGHRVLEIGTGTGYNAALLSHRLGDGRVFSVDIEPDVVRLAAERLARVGYHPTLATVDGEQGLPEHAPYDRIIATVAAPAVPWTWVEQVVDGGLILVDIKLAPNAGNLVLLRRSSDYAEGRFDPTWANFMSMRHHEPPSPTRRGMRRAGVITRRTSLAVTRPWEIPTLWFLTQLIARGELSYGFTGPDMVTAFITSEDGSRADIEERLSGPVGHRVREGGPSSLWRIVERAYLEWTECGEPGWDRFGLTVTPDEQVVWLDEPSSRHCWTLRPSSVR